MGAGPSVVICRILPHSSADGPAHMAMDEALLASVSDDPGAAVLRTYDWSVPTLSLGYFQASAEARLDPRWREVPTVRRPTGGGAIWHDRELTYALIVPRDHPAARRAADLYRAVHGAIAGLLASHGLAAVRRGEGSRTVLSTRPFLCFTDRDPEDIVVAGHKIVGSAQRRRPGAILQHGALLLAGSEATPELPGLGDLTHVATDTHLWSERLQADLPGQLELLPRPDEPTRAERARAETLRRAVYADPAWTDRR